jgi:hypothetical protein
LTDPGLKGLAGLKQLRSLSLRGTQVSDLGVAPLRALTGLRFLNISQTKITGAGIAELHRALPLWRD